MATAAVQTADSAPRVRSALRLGWVVADLFYTPMPKAKPESAAATADLPSASELDPMDVCLGRLQQVDALVDTVGVSAAGETWKSSQEVLRAALRSQVSDSWIATLHDLHIALMAALEAVDPALFHGYDLGRSLRKTCQLPRDAEALQATFGQWRVATIQERLGDLTDHLPPHAANAVAASLGVWARWTAEGAADLVTQSRQRLTRQGHLWLAVLVGEKDAVGMLDPDNYIAASRRLSSKLARVTRRLLWTYWWQVALLALAVVGVILAVVVSGTISSVLGSLGALAAALGITRKGVVAEGEGVLKRVSGELWGAELDLSIGDALTKLPRRSPGFGRRAEQLPAPIVRVPAAGPDPPERPQPAAGSPA